MVSLNTHFEANSHEKISSQKATPSQTNKNFLSQIFQKFSSPSPVSLAEKHLTWESARGVKTAAETSDHRFHYAICDGKIFFRPIDVDKDSPWKEIPFSKPPISISADNGRLIVVDAKRQVHMANTEGLAFRKVADNWEATSFDLEWKKEWLSGHCLGRVFPAMRSSRLFAMECPRSIALSHKGTEAHSFVYMLNSDGSRIFVADSRLKNGFRNEITGPENGRFAAESLAASGSTLFVFKREKDEHGIETHKMYTRFADLDSIRILPPEVWREQPPIPLINEARLSKNIAVFQTGSSPQDRELRVEGTDKNGRGGYYAKKIEDRVWVFHPTDLWLSSAELSAKGQAKKVPKVVHDYKGSIEIQGVNYPAVLRNFSHRGWSERGLHTTIEIEKRPGEIITYPLYAGKDLKQMQWMLLSPEANGTAQKVTLLEKPFQISIEGKGIKGQFHRIDGKTNEKTSLHTVVKTVYRVSHFFLRLQQIAAYILQDIYYQIRGRNKIVYAREFVQHALDLDDAENTKKLILRLTGECPSLAPKAIVELLCHRSANAHIHEMLRGGSVLIEDGGEWLDKFMVMPGVKRRFSSHSHIKGKSWSLQMPLFGELLFWIDKQGKLRLQFEKHSLSSLMDFLGHTIDYLKYRLESEQQGPYGTSPHTDKDPLIINL